MEEGRRRQRHFVVDGQRVRAEVSLSVRVVTGRGSVEGLWATKIGDSRRRGRPRLSDSGKWARARQLRVKMSFEASVSGSED